MKLHHVSCFPRFSGAPAQGAEMFSLARRFPAWLPALPLRLGVHHSWLWQHGVWKCFCHRRDRWHRLSRWALGGDIFRWAGVLFFVWGLDWGLRLVKLDILQLQSHAITIFSKLKCFQVLFCYFLAVIFRPGGGRA